MIRMLADTSFGGNYGEAHTFADTGGDILRTAEWDSEFYVDWKVNLLLMDDTLYFKDRMEFSTKKIVYICISFTGMCLQKIWQTSSRNIMERSV